MIINTRSKRGKGKSKIQLGTKDMYLFYCKKEKAKNRKPKHESIYRAIINDANKLIRDSIVLYNEVIKLPYQIGELGVIKYKTNFNPDRKNLWKVDYKKSKEVGFIVYYDQDNRYKWKWGKKNCFVRGKRWYKFVPCRTASRLIAKALKENNKLDYCNKIS